MRVRTYEKRNSGMQPLHYVQMRRKRVFRVPRCRLLPGEISVRDVFPISTRFSRQGNFFLYISNPTSQLGMLPPEQNSKYFLANKNNFCPYVLDPNPSGSEHANNCLNHVKNTQGW